MSVDIGIRIKNLIRLIEAAAQPRIRTVAYGGQTVRFVRSLWWDNTHVDRVARELDGYFDTIAGRGWIPRAILDVGAEAGLFSVVAGCRFQPCSLWAIEPSLRNRILLRRNLSLNGLSLAGLCPDALWNEPAVLAFRSNGAISSIRGVGSLDLSLPFVERVQARPLDEMLGRGGGPEVDLIKMDIEGAEIEALDGARRTLSAGGPRPKVLIQAYHLRDGRRTLEACAERLQEYGYAVSEDVPGLLAGWPR